MLAVSSIAYSGMSAAQSRLDASGHNVANAATSQFRPQTVSLESQASGGVRVKVGQSLFSDFSLEREVVDQLRAKNDFLMNLAVFRASDDMAGTLLDVLA